MSAFHSIADAKLRGVERLLVTHCRHTSAKESGTEGPSEGVESEAGRARHPMCAGDFGGSVEERDVSEISDAQHGRRAWTLSW